MVRGQCVPHSWKQANLHMAATISFLFPLISLCLIGSKTEIRIREGNHPAWRFCIPCLKNPALSKWFGVQNSKWLYLTSPSERLAARDMNMWVKVYMFEFLIYEKKKSCLSLTSTIWGISTREHYLHMWPNLSRKERIGTIFTQKKRKLSSPWFKGLKNLIIFNHKLFWDSIER